MSTHHPLARADLDLVTLAADLAVRLGRPVALGMQPPGQRVVEYTTEPVMEEVSVPDGYDEDGNVRARTEKRQTGIRTTGKQVVEPPGDLMVLDPATGEPLDVDSRTVAAAVKAHQPPPSAAQRREQALVAAEAKAKRGDTAGALADVLALLRADVPAGPRGA